MEEMGRALLCAPFLGTRCSRRTRCSRARTRATQKELLARDRRRREIVSRRARRAERALGPRRHRACARARRATASSSTARRPGCSTATSPTCCSSSRAATTGSACSASTRDAEGLARSAGPAARHDAQARARRASRRRPRGASRAATRPRTSSACSRSRSRRSPPSRSAARRAASRWRPTTRRRGSSSAARSARYQAIKHKCADMLVAVEFAKSAAYARVLRRGERRAGLPRVRGAREGLLLRGLLPRRRRQHPDPRRHGLHLGAPGPSLLQAREGERAPVRRRGAPPRAARGLRGDLTAARGALAPAASGSLADPACDRPDRSSRTRGATGDVIPGAPTTGQVQFRYAPPDGTSSSRPASRA